MSAEQIGLEAWNQTFGQLSELAAAVRQLLPLLRAKELKYGRIFRFPLGAKMQIRNGGRPRIDVGRQQVRLLDESVNERALAGLDLSDHRDAADLVL